MKGIKSKFLIVFTLAVSMISCQMQVVDSNFIASADAVEGRYCFDVDFSEEGAQYQTFIAIRLKTKAYAADSTISLDICLKDGRETYIERCDFPLFKATDDVKTVGGRGPVADFQWPYRAGISGSPDAGKWRISIEPADKKDLENILGIGFFYAKRK